LLSIQESGSAEYADAGRSRRGRWSEPEFEAGEGYDRDVTLSHWRRPHGSTVTLPDLPLEEGGVSPPGAFEAMEPDEEESHEATGNEGASFDRSYQRAVLALWPRSRDFAVLSQADLTVTLPYLATLLDRQAKAEPTIRARLRNEAHDLAGHMLR